MRLIVPAVISVLLAGTLSSFAAESPSLPEETGAGLFSCHAPVGWKKKDMPTGGVRYSDGRRSISVMRYGGEGSAYATPEIFFKRLNDFAKLEKRDPARVSGREADRFIRSYELSLGGDEYPAQKEWIYEELVILKEGETFWVLKFQSPSRLPADSPKGLAL